ncbi:SDR family NAD(P)-dependent oxidoreductase [Streptomyces sp. NPDC094472]|uniref:SDR family NAD(P)-dependent oxidoreductase n=1 Tax=Streptomyces sp. NPDC094472 TaxID=3155080 RepID=UPI003332BD7B
MPANRSASSGQPLPGRLDGTVALITGAGTGIGAGVVRRFVREGARVVAMGRDADKLERSVEPFGDRAVAVPGDVTYPHDCQRAVQVALERFGRLDVLVPNAGVHDQNVKISDLSTQQLNQAYDQIFEVNLKGALLIVHAALGELVRTSGSIIFTGSISSLAPGFGGPLYVSSKHAVLGLAKQLAYDLAGQVRVNTVALGYVQTELVAPPALGGGGALPSSADVTHRLPTGIEPTPDNVAGAYALLASDTDGSTITGSVFTVDSGQLLWGRTPA